MSLVEMGGLGYPTADVLAVKAHENCCIREVQVRLYLM